LNERDEKAARYGEKFRRRRDEQRRVARGRRLGMRGGEISEGRRREAVLNPGYRLRERKTKPQTRMKKEKRIY